MAGDEKHEGEPVAFGEVFDAATPRLAPGASKSDLLAALRNATATGGHIPGRPAPDISFAAPIVTDLSGGGVRPEIMKALRSGATSLDDIAGALAPVSQPADPFGPGAAPAVALAEMYNDFLGAGIPLPSVERILGTMLAEAGKDGGSEDDAAAELEKVNTILREHGFTYPLGAAGVHDLAEAYAGQQAELHRLNPGEWAAMPERERDSRPPGLYRDE